MSGNVFMRGDMKLDGPNVDEQRILEHATIVFKRCEAAGVKMVVWGSGGSRRIPDGFDPAKARKQFIDIARKVSAIAKEYDIVMAFESLNSTETNFINTAEQALQLVKDVDHSNFRLNIDFYHMLMENEGPAIIEKLKIMLFIVSWQRKKDGLPWCTWTGFCALFQDDEEDQLQRQGGCDRMSVERCETSRRLVLIERSRGRLRSASQSN